MKGTPVAVVDIATRVRQKRPRKDAADGEGKVLRAGTLQRDDRPRKGRASIQREGNQPQVISSNDQAG